MEVPLASRLRAGSPACVSHAGKGSGAGGTQALHPRRRRDARATSYQSCDFKDVFGDIIADGPVFAEHADTFPHAVDGLFAAFAAGKDVGQR